MDEKNVDKILKDFDFVFVGRAAIGDPGIFVRMSGSKKDVEFMDYVKLAKKYKLFFRQVKYQAMSFTKGDFGAKKVRKELIDAKTILEIEKVMKTNK